VISTGTVRAGEVRPEISSAKKPWLFEAETVAWALPWPPILPDFVRQKAVLFFQSVHPKARPQKKSQRHPEARTKTPRGMARPQIFKANPKPRENITNKIKDDSLDGMTRPSCSICATWFR
jgi:hypothetical protein